MNNFRIIPLSAEYAERIKKNRRDDFGNEIIELTATGKGPCRLSLKVFEPGKDKRLLFKHSPFETENAFNQPGPIFIHSKKVKPYSDFYNFPKEIKEHFTLSLIGYNKSQEMNYTKLVNGEDMNTLINNLFDSDEQIDFIHVRNAEACCFICKIVRRQTI